MWRPLLDCNKNKVAEIPIEIVSDEEMALIEASLSLAAAPSSSFDCCSNLYPGENVRSITDMPRKRVSHGPPDIEDSASKRTRVVESLFNRFRNKRGLSVTDITATEWCEKQMEFVLLLGKRKPNEAMQRGSARHTKLEQEVITKVRVEVESYEDAWALKFINFITGANQLLFDGLTRELQLIGFVEGVWMIGVIDEIRMPITGTYRNPILVDTKTRVRDALPSEPQQRNGRLQLMCYKYLWDNLVADKFPAKEFFDFFSLNPDLILSEEIRETTTNSGFPAKTLNDVVRYYRNTFSILPLAHNQLLLRYELQGDNSLIGEDEFTYDLDWVKSQIQGCLEFWNGERAAKYTAEEERWKCRYCDFASACPATAMAHPNS